NILKLYDEIMSKKVVSIDDVYGLYNIDKSILKRYLKKLIEERIIEIKGEEVFIKNKINMNNRSKLISIEVKVKDWRSGLLQARRYLNFSDYSYLGLYVESVEKVDTQDFIDSGIGLLSISETEVTEIIKPKKSKSCDYILKHISISNLMKNKELKNIVATTLENTPINKIWKLKFAQ
ncbi:MAG TPA: hypothetical protein DEG71_11480, partial [Clostridiales bacterium]|nr:hypothetical protein [Clostridiales bacterium]